MSKKAMDNAEVVGENDSVSITNSPKRDSNEVIVYTGVLNETTVGKFYYVGDSTMPRRAKRIHVEDIIYDNEHPRFKSVKEFFEYAVANRGYKYVRQHHE